MPEPMPTVRDLRAILDELQILVEQARRETNGGPASIKDLRWEFDQQSARMNQAIYNEQHEQIRASCLKTLLPLIEILSRT